MEKEKFDFDINGIPKKEFIGDSTDKIIFFKKQIKEKRNISAFHLNDVFCEFSDLFYKNKPYKTVMANFKKWMKYSADMNNLQIIKGRADYIDRIDFGVRTIWTILY